MAEFIEKTDTLNEGREKINAAIQDAEDAKTNAMQAKQIAQAAKDKADSTQTQLDTIVIEGDSSVEAAQARVDEKGQTHATLKERIDNGFIKVNTQLDQNTNDIVLRGVNVKTLGAKGNGLDDDYNILQDAINNYDNIFLPKGVYKISKTLRLDGVNGKNIVFSPGAVVYRSENSRSDNDDNSCFYLRGCEGITFSDITLDSGENGASTLMVLSECENIKFLGHNTVNYSSSWTFVIRPGCSNIFIDTLVVNQPSDKPKTMDGIDIISSNNITINNVIGNGDNEDDLVVLKTWPNRGACYNIQIGKITANGTYGAFSIGSEVLEDIYNVSIGEIVATNTRRGIYFKQWTQDIDSGNRRAQFPDVKYEDYGKVYDIYIGSFTSRNDVRTGFTPIDFHIDDPFTDNFSDITFNNVYIEGLFEYDFVRIDKVKNIHFNNLTTKVKNIEGASGVLSRYGVRIYDVERLRILGGEIQATEIPISTDQDAEDLYISNVKPIGVNFQGEVVEVDSLIYIRYSHAIIENCDLTSPSVTPIKCLNNYNRNKQRVKFVNNKGRDVGLSNPPTTGEWLRGEKVYNVSPSVGNDIGWVCVTEGTPGVWKSLGVITD